MVIAFPAVVVSFLKFLLLACSSLVTVSLVRQRIRQMVLWKVPGPRSASIITGNFAQLFNVDAMPFHEHIRKTYGAVIRITGILGDTQLMVSDPRACTTILLKEQDTFDESSWFIELNTAVFGPGLTSTTGSMHRRQRKMLNPVFSIKHMRSMMPIFQRLTHQLQDLLREKTTQGPQEIDMLEWLSRLALELVAQGGLGYTFNGLSSQRDSEFMRALKDYTPTVSALAPFRELHPLVVSTRMPSKFLKYAAGFLPWTALHNIINQTDVMHSNSKAVFDEKKALFSQGDEAMVLQVGEGKDLISVLLQANTAAAEEDRLPDEEILAQMGTLLSAGTETTSSALCRTFDLLANDQDVQAKLRDELMGASEDELTYDDLDALPFLDAVCRETLRLYPPVGIITRTCRADMNVPLHQPISTTNGDTVSSLFIPRNTDVLIDIRGINRNPDIWGPDAAEWKPERWLRPLPDTVEEARIPGIYSNTLTFLGGGRACIGFKFSQLEMKVVLLQLVRAFRISPSKNSKVIWRYGGIVTPSVEGSGKLTPEMPLVLEQL